MIAGIAWRVLLTLVALVTAGVQFDRVTERRPDLATAVPQPFRSVAQPRVVARSFDNDEAQTALGEARLLVHRRPIPAEHLTALAHAQYRAGSPEQSAVTIQYAAQRGWRDPIAQEAALRLALETGDEAEAARRYAALFLMQSTPEALLEELGPAVLNGDNSTARETFGAIVAGADRWHDLFARRGSRVLPPDAFAHIFAKLAESGAIFTCKNVRNSRRALARRDALAVEPLDRYMERAC